MPQCNNVRCHTQGHFAVGDVCFLCCSLHKKFKWQALETGHFLLRQQDRFPFSLATLISICFILGITYQEHRHGDSHTNKVEASQNIQKVATHKYNKDAIEQIATHENTFCHHILKVLSLYRESWLDDIQCWTRWEMQFMGEPCFEEILAGDMKSHLSCC